MSEITSIELRLENFLWWSRGKNWDRELVSCPKGLKSDNWSELFSLILPDEPSGSEIKSRLGTLHIEGGILFFLATAFESQLQKDWTNRPIPHYIVFFQPGCESEEDFKKKIGIFPENWPLQLDENYLGRFYESELFLLPEDDVRGWRETKKQPFQEYIQQQFSQILPKTVVIRSSEPFLEFKPNSVYCKKIFSAPAPIASDSIGALVNNDLSSYPEQLKEEFNAELGRLCKDIASKTEAEYYPNAGVNEQELIEIYCKCFNGRPTDLSIIELARRTLKSQSLSWGVVKHVYKKAKNVFLNKHKNGNLVSSDPSSNGIGLEMLAKFLARHACSELKRIQNDEDGQKWLAKLFPKASYDDQTIRALFVRAQFLAKELT